MNTSPDGLLTAREAAMFLRISERWMAKLKANGEIPFVRIGSRRIRYKISDLQNYVDQQLDQVNLQSKKDEAA